MTDDCEDMKILDISKAYRIKCGDTVYVRFSEKKWYQRIESHGGHRTDYSLCEIVSMIEKNVLEKAFGQMIANNGDEM